MTESPLERLRRKQAEERGETSGGASAVRRGGIGAAVTAALVFVVTKGKLVLLFVLTKGKLVFAAVKLGPLLATVGTMAVSAWAFAAYYGAGLAIGIVLTILVHELGHGAAAKAMGLKVGAPVFIPLFGAVIAMKEQPRSTWIEAVVGYGGPLAGTAAGLAAWAWAASLPPGHLRGLLFVIAWFTFLINLFNLLPVFGLDGARVSKAFRSWHWVPGGLFLVGILAWETEWTGRVNPFLLLILILGAAKAGSAWWRARRGGEAAEGRLIDRLRRTERYVSESDVRPWQRHCAAVGYFALAAALPLLAALANAAAPAVR